MSQVECFRTRWLLLVTLLACSSEQKLGEKAGASAGGNYTTASGAGVGGLAEGGSVDAIGGGTYALAVGAAGTSNAMSGGGTAGVVYVASGGTAGVVYVAGGVGDSLSGGGTAGVQQTGTLEQGGGWQRCSMTFEEATQSWWLKDRCRSSYCALLASFRKLGTGPEPCTVTMLNHVRERPCNGGREVYFDNIVQYTSCFYSADELVGFHAGEDSVTYCSHSSMSVWVGQELTGCSETWTPLFDRTGEMECSSGSGVGGAAGAPSVDATSCYDAATDTCLPCAQ